MGYMRDSTGRRLDSFKAIGSEEADARFLRQSVADSRYQLGSLAPLYGYYAKASQARLQRCDILIVGDSIAEGFGASTLEARWVMQAQALLREQYLGSSAGGWGFLPAQFVSSAGSGGSFDKWVFAGERGTTGNGLGARAVQLRHHATTPGQATVTRVCTSFKLYFRRNSVDQVTIAIDGGTPVTYSLNTSQTHMVWTSPALTSGAHTIVVKQTGGSSSGPELVGGMFYNNDETAGMALWDGSLSGARMKTWDVDNPDWLNYLSLIPFSALILTCATNDARVSSGGYSVAEYKAYTKSIITKARAKIPNLPVLLMPPFEPVTTPANRVAPWADYVIALRQIADETPYVSVFDMSARIPYLSPDTYGFLMDGVHPTSLGHGLLGQLTATALIPN